MNRLMIPILHLRCDLLYFMDTEMDDPFECRNREYLLVLDEILSILICSLSVSSFSNID